MARAWIQVRGTGGANRIRRISRFNEDGDGWLSGYIGKVFHVLRNRNSYNWSFSVNYAGAGAVHPTLEDAKNYVHKHREKGSRWAIDECPALVISGTDYALCLAITENEEQFRYFRHVEIAHKTLARIAAAFGQFSASNIFLYRARFGEITPPTTPLARYSSQSYGGDYGLSWASTDKSDVRLSNIFDLQKKIWHLI